MDCRPYDPDRDRADLWALKRAFERELGATAGSEAKQATYEAKLTPDYRERYLEWVARCITAAPDSVVVAEADADADANELLGYVFVLPETMAMIWDAAVLNELYIAPSRRGTGLADDLLEAAIDVVRSQSLPLDRLVLDVDPANERAAAFYRRHGFTPWGELVARPLDD